MTLLETVGAAVYKIGTKRKKGDHQGTMQTPGIPDLLAFVTVPLLRRVSMRGVSQLWIEVKRPGGTMQRGAVPVPTEAFVRLAAST